MRINVIGCGVSGLSTAIRLLEAGHDVEIWARDLPPHTTSNIAAAIWHPYKAFPVERVTGWGQRTLEVFYSLAGIPGAGVSLMEAVEVFSEPVDDPWWLDCVRHFRRALPGELPGGFKDGYVFETVVVETRIYLTRLMDRVVELGGQIIKREVPTLDEVLEDCRAVVNCSGLGARTLVGDASLYPIRGQIIRASKPPVGRVMLDVDDKRGVTYIVPRSTDCILGGTAQEGNWSLEADPAVAASILERCGQLASEVRDVQILEHLVGLRPGRPTVRLEVEPAGSGKFIVHNYGHGGAGVTLSWGCAEEVVSLLGQS